MTAPITNRRDAESLKVATRVGPPPSNEETMSTPGPAGPATTHRVQAPGGGLHVIDQPGTEPPVVLLHGFPDDSGIYDRLIPHLAPHRAIAFDGRLSAGRK